MQTIKLLDIKNLVETSSFDNFKIFIIILKIDISVSLILRIDQLVELKTAQFFASISIQ
jgi:hypothetical protein